MIHRKTLTTVTLAATLLSSQVIYASPLDNKTLSFKNKRGSVLVLSGHKTGKDTGKLSGTFTTAVASKSCQSVINKPFSIRGYYNGSTLSYTVNYVPCGSVQATVGNFDQQLHLSTLNLLSYRSQQVDSHDFNKRFIIHDLFVKAEPKS